MKKRPLKVGSEEELAPYGKKHVKKDTLPKFEVLERVKDGYRVVVTQAKSLIDCYISGPRATINPKEDSQTSFKKGALTCKVTFMNVSKDKNRTIDELNSLQAFYEASVVQSLEESIILEKFPLAILQINVQIYSIDEFILTAIVNGTSLCCILSKIECFGITCCTKLNTNPSLTVAMLPNREKITFLYTEESMDMKVLGKNLSKCFKQCGEIHKSLKKEIEKVVSSLQKCKQNG